MKAKFFLIGTLLFHLSFMTPAYSDVKCKNVPAENLALAEKYMDGEQFQEAALIYRCHLNKHPHAKDVYIDYAEDERILENYSKAISILQQYRALFPEDKEYLMTKARVFADAGYYDSALQINDPLLKKYPNDSYIMATEASALFQSGRRTEALRELNHLTKIDPTSEDLNFLNDEIKKSLQPSISIGYRFYDYFSSTLPTDLPSSGQYINQNDSVNIYRVPILLEVPLSFNTSLLFRGQYEYLSAANDSDLVTNNGKTSIEDYEFYVGMQRLITPTFDVQGFIGDLQISNGLNYFVYDFVAGWTVNQRLKYYFQILHDLFRPIDLTNGSPKSVSLGILETGGRLHANYKFNLQSTIDVDFRASSLSRGNNYDRLAVEPGIVLYNTNRTNLAMGLNTEWLHFHKDVLEEDGYYSPRLYQLYELIFVLDLHPKPNVLVQFYLGGGVTHDENSAGFGLASDVGIELNYTIYKNLDLVAEFDYLSRSLEPFYSEYDVSVGLTWRL